MLHVGQPDPIHTGWQAALQGTVNQAGHVNQKRWHTLDDNALTEA
jgi:hypothetical protein